MTAVEILRWVRRHGVAHSARWVALHDGSVVASASTRDSLIEHLEATGELGRCVLVPIPGVRL
jgi:hypothetical protein